MTRKREMEPSRGGGEVFCRRVRLRELLLFLGRRGEVLVFAERREGSFDLAGAFPCFVGGCFLVGFGVGRVRMDFISEFPAYGAHCQPIVADGFIACFSQLDIELVPDAGTDFGWGFLRVEIAIDQYLGTWGICLEVHVDHCLAGFYDRFLEEAAWIKVRIREESQNTNS